MAFARVRVNADWDRSAEEIDELRYWTKGERRKDSAIAMGE